MKIKNTYLLLVTILGLVSLAMYTTYAMFTASLDIGGFVDLTASSLPTDTSVIEYERLTLSAGESKIIELNITNATDSSLYYGVWYEMIEPTSINDNIVIAKLDTSASETIGELSSSSSTTVTLILENNTTDSVVINLGVGYSETSSLNLPTNRNIVTATGSEGIDMSDVVIPETADFDYTGAVQTYTVSTTGTYKLEVWGAQGGTYNSSYASGGAGGYSYGTVTLNEGDSLYLYVGKAGSYGTTTTYTTASGAGINGGAAAGYRGGTGGDASDIRLDINNDGSGTLYERIIVAGGGGGAYSYSSTYKAAGGVGGGTSGASGSYYSSTYSAWVGGGASQTAGGSAGTGSSTNYYGKAGSFGTGGASGYKYNSTSYYSNGAGGGGWYGGGSAGNYSSSSRTRAAGGGGGSGFVLTSSTASNVPSSYLITDTSYYLTDAATVAGSSSFTSPTGSSETGHTGNGYARISYISTVPSLDGLTDVSVPIGESYDLLSNVTCVDNGDGCTLVKASITDTSILSSGEYTVSYIVKDNNGVKYKYTRKLFIADDFNKELIKLSQGDTWESGASGLYEITYTKEDGTTTGKDYRYIGVNVSNYVKFNDDMYQIIGVFDENTHGVEGEYLIKLIAANRLSANSWGVTNTDASSGVFDYYANDWTGKEQSSIASLNVLLNQYFLNKTNTSDTYGNCKNWAYYQGSSTAKVEYCSTLVGYGIKDSMRNYIETVTWHLNGYNSVELTANDFYLCERGMYTNCTSANNGGADTSTSAKIGLMYVSDYMYASGYNSSNIDLTGDSQYNGVQNWLFNGTEWTITPVYDDTLYIFDIWNNGKVTSSGHSVYGYGYRPTFYLKSSVKLTGGKGTYDNPYTIG